MASQDGRRRGSRSRAERAAAAPVGGEDGAVSDIVNPRKRLLGQRLEHVRSVDQLAALAHGLGRRRPAPFSRCLFALTHSQVPDGRARRLLERVIAHRSRLEAHLGRPVALRVAALDLLSPSTPGVGRLVLIPRRRLFTVARWVTEDPLTGLRNRRALKVALEVEAYRSARFGRPLSVLMVDVDDFKGYNDRFGHAAGDEALRGVARTLARCARSSDTVARCGGEEFAVVAPETGSRGGRALAERMRAAVLAASAEAGLEAPVTVSVGGVTRGGRSRAEPGDLLGAADRALYEAKRAGKNRVVWARRGPPRRAVSGAARQGPGPAPRRAGAPHAGRRAGPDR